MPPAPLEQHGGFHSHSGLRLRLEEKHHHPDFGSSSCLWRITGTLGMDYDLVIKVKYGDTLRRFNAFVNEGIMEIDMASLRAKVLDFFTLSADADVTLTYVDVDNDIVALVDDNDLRDAVLLQHLNPLRISVTLKDNYQSVPPSGNSTPLRSSQVRTQPLGASSGSSMFFTSSATAPPSVSFPLPSPAFSMPNQPVSFGLTASSNDQMNIEDTLQPTNVPSSPLFGQVANAPSSTPQPFVFGSLAVPFGGTSVFQFSGHPPPPTSTPQPFVFGSPAVPSGGASVFQFGGHPPQTPSLFSPAGGAPAGSFSWGTPAGSLSWGTTEGSDKSGRRIVKIRRDKARKK